MFFRVYNETSVSTNSIEHLLVYNYITVNVMLKVQDLETLYVSNQNRILSNIFCNKYHFESLLDFQQKG